jgi:hypothetical protein
LHLLLDPYRNLFTFTAMQLSTTNWLPRCDQLGAVLSFGCAIHCIGTPIFLAVLPLGMHGIFTEAAETQVLAFAVCLALLTHLVGFYRHQSGLSFGILAALTILGISRLVPEESGRGFVTLFGGLLLAISHLVNCQQCRRICCAQNHSQQPSIQ